MNATPFADSKTRLGSVVTNVDAEVWAKICLGDFDLMRCWNVTSLSCFVVDGGG